MATNLKIRYAVDKILISDTERKLPKLLQKIVNKSKKKRLNINFKKTECLTISPEYKIQIGDINNQEQKLNI